MRVVRPFVSSDGTSFVHLLDNSGNEIVLAQLLRGELNLSVHVLK